ncbi:protein NRT1/ PTR FAMILY 7.3-like [Silene latifolia]|uniref:protein NRT1/ PTR FAMILY 7.3-like n=1 Tax=Silene latifolia TaxID=37657 RepID=UPI003D77EAB7
MACMNIFQKDVSPEKTKDNKVKKVECTLDGSVDRHGNPAIRSQTGRWGLGILILVNQGLATLAFFGVGVNLVLYLTRVLGQNNADAANNVSKWTGTVYLFSLLGAFLSDSYWGRYKSCAIFQAIFTLGLGLMSLSSYLFLLKPRGCGDEQTPCNSHSSNHVALFYLSIYMVALGYGGYQPNIATLGADQFDDEDPKERSSKISFFSYFYLALNLGSLFSNTILGYFEDGGEWTIGFWASAASALIGLLLFLSGTPFYRHFKPRGNPLSRFCKVFVAAIRKWNAHVPQDDDDDESGLYELDAKAYSKTGAQRISHTDGFRFLDKAAVITVSDKKNTNSRWHLCTVTQIEEVKCILRLIPIWLCTILYSVVFTQMASLFVEQGAAMKTNIGRFHIPPASMSSFDILSVAAFIFIYRRVVHPLVARVRKKEPTELQRMGIGLIIAILAMVASGIVEVFRLKYATENCKSCQYRSSLTIFWQIPQYMLVGASEVFMYVGQLEFFNGQAPEGLKSFGSALCMMSMSLGNYVSSIIVTIVMKISSGSDMPGWIPGELNKGHLDRFFFLLAALTAIDFMVYLFFAKSYKYVQSQVIKGEVNSDEQRNNADNQV